MPKTIIEVNNLSKVFIRHKKMPGFKGSIKGLFIREKIETRAVDQINFSIKEGEIVGFLGANGAGKTTTLKMLAGILYPTSGQIAIDGFIPQERKNEFKKSIGMVMGQKQQLLWDLPAEDSFELLKELFAIQEDEYHKHLNRLVRLLDVKDLLNIQVRQLSLGQRMKMEIIAALIHQPKILFLDEPTLGLDIVSQKNIREFFKEYNREHKTTILLTSHYMEDIKSLCERVIIINHGQIVYDNLLSKLVKDRLKHKIIRITLSKASSISLAKYGKIIKSDSLQVELAVDRTKATLVAKQILDDLEVEDINIDEPEAEEVVREIFQSKVKIQKLEVKR